MKPATRQSRSHSLDEDFRWRFGDWAVVTGASDGIGREFARALAARELKLVLVARRPEPLNTLAEELATVHGVKCRVVVADLSSDEGNKRLLEETAQLEVGLLVAAAGFGTSGPFRLAGLSDEQQMLAVNCGALLEQCWHYSRRFAARGRGGIVLMSSLLAFQGTARSANYAATKAYVQTLAEGLREELRPLGVSVVASAPGPVATGFGARANMRMPLALEPRVVALQTLASLGRSGTVRPGWLSKLLGWSLATAPRGLRIKIMGLVMQDMTAHQRAESGAIDRPSA